MYCSVSIFYCNRCTHAKEDIRDHHVILFSHLFPKQRHSRQSKPGTSPAMLIVTRDISCYIMQHQVLSATFQILEALLQQRNRFQTQPLNKKQAQQHSLSVFWSCAGLCFLWFPACKARWQHYTFISSSVFLLHSKLTSFITFYTVQFWITTVWLQPSKQMFTKSLILFSSSKEFSAVWLYNWNKIAFCFRGLIYMNNTKTLDTHFTEVKIQNKEYLFICI